MNTTLRPLYKSVTIFALAAVALCHLSFLPRRQDDSVLIWFRQYGVQIRSIERLGDTIDYKVSSKEHFKFVFFDTRGKSYCERFRSGKLYEQGYFENSLDTLKVYVSSRDLNGNHSPVRVQKYFEPVKNGIWKIYSNGKVVKTETYTMGGIENN